MDEKDMGDRAAEDSLGGLFTVHDVGSGETNVIITDSLLLVRVASLLIGKEEHPVFGGHVIGTDR